MKSIHIFKTGTHTDSHGTQITFSESDLAGAVSAYDANKHQAPIVVGHPKTNNPAFGWITALSAKNGNLYAEPEQVNTDFSEQVKAGAYKKVSASFYPPNSPNNPVKGKYYLRHVGFLGAEPPAIKGLESVEFGEGDSGDDAVTLELEFAESDGEQSSMKKMFTAFMGWLSSSDFSELTDESSSGNVNPNPADNPTDNPSNQPNPTDNLTDPTDEDDDMPTQEQLDAEKARADELQAQLDARDKADAEAKVKAQEKDNADFAEGLVNDEKIAPKDSAMVSAILNALDTADSVTPVEFGEGDDKTSLKQALKDKLTNANTDTFASLFSEAAGKPKHDPDHVEYAEGTDPERAELDQQIRAYAKEHELEYSEAAHIVMSM